MEANLGNMSMIVSRFVWIVLKPSRYWKLFLVKNGSDPKIRPLPRKFHFLDYSPPVPFPSRTSERNPKKPRNWNSTPPEFIWCPIFFLLDKLEIKQFFPYWLIPFKVAAGFNLDTSTEHVLLDSPRIISIK